MSVLTAIILLFLSIGYISIMIIALTKTNKSATATNLLDLEKREKEFKTMYFEEIILRSLKLQPKNMKLFIYLERIILIVGLSALLVAFRGLAFCFVGCIFAILFFNDAYKKVIYESGINNIVMVNNFINYFVPHINSGNSADQSLLGYIEYSNDEELRKYYENKSDIDINDIAPHVKQIIDIYDIAKYNEEKGIADYTYILNEISQDYEAKSRYYNRFISSIGEIKPTEFSYYIGVPILIFISYNQTKDFWAGFGGFILSIALLGLFVLFKFLIFKLQKNTISKIF